MKRHWIKMGIEVEGAWVTDYNTLCAAVYGAKWHDDQSVRGLSAPYRGELVTRPHADIDKLVKDVLALWPDQYNATCGLHIHTSFTPGDTGLLTDDSFWDYFQLRWLDWGNKVKAPGVFWDRYYGNVPDQARRYKREWKPLVQLAMDDHNQRYTQLNFVPWHKIRTVECRLLPMFPSQEMAVSAIFELADMYETYLNTMAFKGLKSVREVNEVGNMVVEMNTKLLPEHSPWEEKVEATGKPVLVGTDIEYEYDDVDGNEFVPTRGKPYRVEAF